jgi:hypothetical protein
MPSCVRRIGRLLSLAGDAEGLGLRFDASNACSYMQSIMKV